MSGPIVKVMESNNALKKHSENLEKLGSELSKLQFDFKIKDKPSEKYWVERIQEFANYHKKTVDYFTEAYLLMTLSNEEQSKIFLLSVSKLTQLGKKVLEDMQEVKKNPSIMNQRDKQQSKWSKELRDNLINSNNDCLDHEKRMNIFFKNFFDNFLKK